MSHLEYTPTGVAFPGRLPANMTSSQKRKYKTYCTVVRENQAAATVNMYRKFCKVWTCVFEICKSSDTQTGTDRHTDMLIATCHTPTEGDKVNELNTCRLHVAHKYTYLPCACRDLSADFYSVGHSIVFCILDVLL